MWVTSTPCTSAMSNPAVVSPRQSTSKASSVFHPASTRYGPFSVSKAYTSTYRSGLFGIGTGMLHSPGRTSSTGGSGCSTTGALPGSAVHVDALPGDVEAGVGHQEAHHARHVFGRAH